jgi:hypothetical protein
LVPKGFPIPSLPSNLLAVLPPDLVGDAGAAGLLARFLDEDGAACFRRPLAHHLLAVARGAGGDRWEVRCLAALMLQQQVLRLPENRFRELADLLARLGLLDATGLVRASVLAEGFSTTEPRAFAGELRRRLARAEPALRGLRGRDTSRDAWRRFLALARCERKLALARYLFTPREVVERMLGRLRSSRGLEHPFTSGRDYVEEETERALALLPPYEAEVVDLLCRGFAVRWVTDGTSTELGALVEAPLGTVVAVGRPPGSDLEIEWKRAGRRGPRPLGVVFRRRGREVPPSHRLDAGSMVQSLQWEAISAAVLSRVFRAVHGVEAPVSRTVSILSIHGVPAHRGEVVTLDYLTDPRCFGGPGFQWMRRALRESTEAFERERDSEPEDLPGELGLTVRFLNKLAPAQAVLCGTSSLRLDRAALYLSPKGPAHYFGKTPFGKTPFGRHDACWLADQVLEEALGEYEPPRGRFQDPESYVTAALAANRARADRVYLDLLRQIGTLWGVIAGCKGHSHGESFVARNVGLRSVFRHGHFKVELVFMDHDNLRLGARHRDDFHPVDTTVAMETDERYIMGSWRMRSSVRGLAEYLDEIYRAGPALIHEGRAVVLEALAVSYRRTLRELWSPALRELFCEPFVERVHEWDALVRELVRRPPAEDTEEHLRAWVPGFLAARGHEPYFIDECVAAFAQRGAFLRRYAFLYA